MKQRKKIIYFLSILAIIFSGFLIYANTLKNGFVYDDETFVVQNPAIRSLNSPLRFLIDRNTSSHNPQMNRDVWRPFTTLSYAFTYHFSGLNPKIFHLCNMIIHLINGLLVYFLTVFFIRNRILALTVALVFIAHPVQTESVAWISQRSNLLFSSFYLFSFLPEIPPTAKYTALLFIPYCFFVFSA